MTSPEMNLTAIASSTVLIDTSCCSVVFNVMPGRAVKEDLRIREFRIGADWIEAEFDRSYSSEMLNSPSHLTFIAALIQMQKVTYVYCCYRLGFDPNPILGEHLKIWPTSVTVTMRDLVTEESRLVHRMEFQSFRKLNANKYLAVARSTIGVLQIDASALVMLLQDST
jgi:hypothetical protein